MARKVIIDCDPGIDDALALCMALFDPRLDVVAVTATAGNVSAEQASRNVQAVVELLDPPRYPRIGAAGPVDDAPAIDPQHIHGADGLGNSGLTVADLHHRHPSEKVIYDAVGNAPDEITLITLGPLTNVARMCQRDPELASSVGQIVIMGGAQIGRGNVTPAAEFNMYYDPASARAVFRSPTTKTLIPLDVTRQVLMTLDLLDALPDETTRAGGFLRRVVPFAFRAQRQRFGLEGIWLHDAVALVAATDPDLFQTTEMAGDVEISGELTVGATVFDRREKTQWRENMEVATEVDAAGVKDRIVRALAAAGRQT